MKRFSIRLIYQQMFQMMVIMGALLGVSASVLANSLDDATSSLWRRSLAKLEASSHGRISLVVIDTADGEAFQYHAQQRFPLASTHKLMVVAAILKKGMSDTGLLPQKIMYEKTDIVSYSPVTAQHVHDGMSVVALCQAAMVQSDNTAVNLLIKKLGGVHEVNAFARAMGDRAFRLDRTEPTLNSAILHDARDTTTPYAMAKSLQRLVLGPHILDHSQRQQLKTWLIANTTGDASIRAGVPKGWIVGDKTGTGGYGSINDVGIIWPPHHAPIVLTIYFTTHRKHAEPRSDVIASATRIMIRKLGKGEASMHI